MVVPTDEPTSRRGPLKQSLFFKFTSFRSEGVSKRQPHEIRGRPPRQPIVNDLHVASLYSDKVLAERQLSELRAEHRELQAKCRSLESVAHIAEGKVKKARDTVAHMPSQIIAFDGSLGTQRLANEANAKATQARHSRDAALIKEAKATRAKHDAVTLASAARFAETEASSRLSTANRRADTLAERLTHASSRVAELGKTVRDMQTVLDATSRNVCGWLSSTERVAELELALENAETELAKAEADLATVKAETAPKRGRPAGHRGADWLLDHWEGYNKNARKVAFWRHCEDIRDALEGGGVGNWLPSALAVVLDAMPAGDAGSWVDVLFATRQFARRKNVLISELREVAQAEWGVDLAQHAITTIGLSSRQYQDLRNAFSRSFYKPTAVGENTTKAGMHTPRPWYKCRYLGTVFNLPEPLPPWYRVQELMKASLAPMGLNLSQDGRISERSFITTLQQTFVRDRASLKIFDVRRPAHPCFGIDHARISGARDFTQGGLTMGGCYKGGALVSEQKHVSLCVGGRI